MEGLKEKIKGKLTRNPDLVQHGREVYTGEQKRKELTGEVGLWSIWISDNTYY